MNLSQVHALLVGEDDEAAAVVAEAERRIAELEEAVHEMSAENERLRTALIGIKTRCEAALTTFTT